ncbi:hypothetical protein P7J56_03915 [Streptococcus suis]|uniref:hypothetical protein n=1 Tax=Streptococcus suis TaxID=1307 RepID=UPI0005CF0B27|nr:hypothetical protein [Streptococcus suis]CYY89728.1 phage protein [Streptococcus suis]
MALFGGKEKLSKEEKRQQKYEEILTKQNEKTMKYLRDRGIEKLDEASFRQVDNIATKLAGKDIETLAQSLINIGGKGGKTEDIIQINYLQALVEQNWILVNQNQQIIDELRKLNEK